MCESFIAGVKIGDMTRAKASAKNQVIQALVRSIQEGALKAGEKLPTERDLIKQFNVSRSVVREALSILSAYGLIQSNFGCRPVVNPRYDFFQVSRDHGVNLNLNISGFDVSQIYETRVLIETALVRFAAIHATKTDVTKMKDMLLKNRRSINRSSNFYETDVQFHAVLYEIPQNPIFPLIHSNYVNLLFKYWRLMPDNIEINKANYNDHKNILEAIIDHDPDCAESFARKHLTSAWQYVKIVF